MPSIHVQKKKPVHLDSVEALMDALAVKQPRQFHVATRNVHQEMRMALAAPETVFERNIQIR